VDSETGTGWVIVASFLGLDGDWQADLLVTNLTGQGVPAQRLPCLPTTSLPMASWPMIRSVQVLVPPEHEDDAREVIAEQPSWPMRPELRLVLQFWVIASGLGILGGLIAIPSVIADVQRPRVSGSAGAAQVAVAVLGLWAFGALTAALLRDGRLRLDARPLIVATMLFLPFLLLAGPLASAASAEMSVAEVHVRIVLLVTLYIGMPILIILDRRARQQRERDN
jgi:hypothetical protein